MNVPILILGTLKRFGPMHGYDLKKIFEHSHVDQWAPVLTGSIYHALKQLEKPGFIAITKVESSGFKAKAKYGITSSGKSELKRLLKNSLFSPENNFPAGLYICLTFIQELDTVTAIESIEEAIRHLETRYDYWQKGRQLKTNEVSNPPLMHLVFENGFAHLQADIQMLKKARSYLSKLNT